MKIIHIAAGIQETCGVSQFVVNVARAQQAAGHDVTIITSMTCGYPVADLHVILSPDPVAVLDTLFTSHTSPLIIHLHSMWNRYIHNAAVWCRKNRVPYVCSPHGSATPWAMHYKWWKKIPAWWLYQRKDFAGAAAFHATVPDEESDIRRLGFTQPVVIAPLGADLVERDQSKSRVEVEGWKDVLFLSRIHPKKNVPALIRAWSILKKSQEGVKNIAARLIIAGSDDVGHQAELVELAKSLGLRVVDFSHDLEFGKKTICGGGEVPVETFKKLLADCDTDVVFTGPVYSAAKDWMFAHAWIFVLPSHSENFGGVVVESLAHGTPVIASKGTPWSELETECCGWWVETSPESIANAIGKALAMSVGQRDEMSGAAKSLVGRKYSWKASAEKLVEIYKLVLNASVK